MNTLCIFNELTVFQFVLYLFQFIHKRRQSFELLIWSRDKFVECINFSIPKAAWTLKLKCQWNVFLWDFCVHMPLKKKVKISLVFVPHWCITYCKNFQACAFVCSDPHIHDRVLLLLHAKISNLDPLFTKQVVSRGDFTLSSGIFATKGIDRFL